MFRECRNNFKKSQWLLFKSMLCSISIITELRSFDFFANTTSSLGVLKIIFFSFLFGFPNQIFAKTSKVFYRPKFIVCRTINRIFVKLACCMRLQIEFNLFCISWHRKPTIMRKKIVASFFRRYYLV